VISWGQPVDRIENRLSIRLLGWSNLAFCRGFHHLSVNGRLGVPPVGPAIVICNHTSGLDPLLIQSCSNRLIVWMMAREYYEIQALGWVFRTIEAIPVQRNGRDLAAMRSALRALEQGRILGIFPEGKIERTRDLLPFQTGVALLAAKAKVPIYPAFLDGNQRGKEMTETFFHPISASLRFGKPVQLDYGNVDRATLESNTEKLAGAVRRLSLTGKQR
jgi:1-acyl-sn-glycerol-3-phosphate acyltransferase